MDSSGDSKAAEVGNPALGSSEARNLMVGESVSVSCMRTLLIMEINSATLTRGWKGTAGVKDALHRGAPSFAGGS